MARKGSCGECRCHKIRSEFPKYNNMQLTILRPEIRKQAPCHRVELYAFVELRQFVFASEMFGRIRRLEAGGRAVVNRALPFLATDGGSRPFGFHPLLCRSVNPSIVATLSQHSAWQLNYGRSSRLSPRRRAALGRSALRQTMCSSQRQPEFDVRVHHPRNAGAADTLLELDEAVSLHRFERP